MKLLVETMQIPRWSQHFQRVGRRGLSGQDSVEAASRAAEPPGNRRVVVRRKEAVAVEAVPVGSRNQVAAEEEAAPVHLVDCRTRVAVEEAAREDFRTRVAAEEAAAEVGDSMDYPEVEANMGCPGPADHMGSAAVAGHMGAAQAAPADCHKLEEPAQVVVAEVEDRKGSPEAACGVVVDLHHKIVLEDQD